MIHLRPAATVRVVVVSLKKFLDLDQATEKRLAIFALAIGRLLLKLEELQDDAVRKTLEPKEQTVTLSDEEQQAALELLHDPQLLNRILTDYERCGVVGEETNKLVCYLAAVSRKLDEPLAIIIQSSSAAAARIAKGWSQTELADRLDTALKMIDYYERRANNPSVEFVRQAARILGISVAELLGEEVQIKRARKTGPTSKVQKVFETVSSLPRRQQEKIIEVVTAIVRQYEQSRQ